jgi:F-type H+-transporting ATPase subunit a
VTGVTAETWKFAQATQDGHGTGVGHAAPDAGHGAAQSAAEGAAHGGGHGSGIDPMHQFEIKRIVHLDLFGLDISFTNSAFFMLFAVAAISVFLIYAMRGRSLVPGRLQSTAELSYQFVANMVRENAGTAGMQYFPFIFSIFIFILTLNMQGLIPYFFTVTSHIIVTFAMALMVFLFVIGVGFAKNGPGFLKLFVPSGVPAVMLPFISVLEVFSFFIRPISLSVRLFANMMAGHMMLKVFASFVVGLGLIGGWAPLAFMVAFTGLEVLVAFLQAFVFTVLTCIYLNDALHMHH